MTRLQPMTPAQDAERLAETLQLATAIADSQAHALIEWCPKVDTPGSTWYDTRIATAKRSVFLDAGVVIDVTICVNYLELRDRIVRHPFEPHLVRFVDPIKLRSAAAPEGAA